MPFVIFFLILVHIFMILIKFLLSPVNDTIMAQALLQIRVVSINWRSLVYDVVRFSVSFVISSIVVRIILVIDRRLLVILFRIKRFILLIERLSFRLLENSTRVARTIATLITLLVTRVPLPREEQRTPATVFRTSCIPFQHQLRSKVIPLPPVLTLIELLTPNRLRSPSRSRVPKCGERFVEFISLTVEDFYRNKFTVAQLNGKELDQLIATQKHRGDQNVMFAEIEKNNRLAMPFSAFVLTIIGVSLSSRKRRGGIGWNIALGIGIGFSYILFMKFSEMFVHTDTLPASIALWLPNIIYVLVAAFLYYRASR